MKTTTLPSGRIVADLASSRVSWPARSHSVSAFQAAARLDLPPIPRPKAENPAVTGNTFAELRREAEQPEMAAGAAGNRPATRVAISFDTVRLTVFSIHWHGDKERR